jgi:hypothetical protein
MGSGQITNKRPTVPQEMVVTDVTGDESNYSLYICAFEYGRHVSTQHDFVDEEKIVGEYYPECEQLLKDVCVASLDFIRISAERSLINIIS